MDSEALSVLDGISLYMAPDTDSHTTDPETQTTVLCVECGHRRETTEQYPTLVCCENCGSPAVTYE